MDHVVAVARFEASRLLGSFRALVVLVLFVCASALAGQSYVFAVNELEEQAQKMIAQQGAGAAAGETFELAKSPIYEQFLKKFADDDSDSVELWKKTPPIILANLYFALLFLPFLLMVTTHDIFAKDNELGTFRFVRPRASALAWVLGKFLTHSVLSLLGAILAGVVIFFIGMTQLKSFDTGAALLAFATLWWRVLVFEMAIIGVISAISASVRTSFGALLASFAVLSAMWVAHWMIGAASWFGSMHYLGYLSPFSYRVMLMRPVSLTLVEAVGACLAFAVAGLAIAQRATLRRKA